jgi:Zn-dependent protease with chaperone function
MTLPYSLRLVCLCLQSLFLVNVAMTIACIGIAGSATRAASTMRPANAARLFLTLRLLPFATALLIVVGLCIPSYLRYEQNTGTEATGWFCLLAAVFGLGLCITTVSRCIHAILKLRSMSEAAKQLPTQLSALASTPLCIADPNTTGAPLLSLVGILKPRLIVSPRLLQTLSPEQFDAALAHEDAHLLSRDNLKRLLLAVAPGVLPFAPGSRSIERQWQRYAELTADETASRGLPDRSIALAEALIHVARLANIEREMPFASSLAASHLELALRIDRLMTMGTIPAPLINRRRAWNRVPFGFAFAALLALLPALFHPLYRLLETLLH